MDKLTKDIVEFADIAVRQTWDIKKWKLDYSPKSLELVEQVLAEVSDFYESFSDEQRLGVINHYGSYVLEVGRRQFGGKYQWLAQRNQPILVVEKSDASVALVALDKVEGRFKGDSADHIPFFYDGFAKRLNNLEPGTRALYT